MLIKMQQSRLLRSRPVRSPIHTPVTSRPSCGAPKLFSSPIVSSNNIETACSASWRQVLTQLTAGLASAVIMLSHPGSTLAAEITPAGGSSSLMQQEQVLYNLVVDKERELQQEITQQRQALEQAVRQSQLQSNQLCATPFGIDIVGVTIFVALIGAAVGGYTAKQRKEEVERLNEQLRKINASLRQQARAGAITQYANGSNGNGNGNGSSSSMTVSLPVPAVAMPTPSAAAAAAPGASMAAVTLWSMDEDELTAEQLECKQTLKAGKSLLKEMKAAAAQTKFEQALVLSRMIGDRVQERRATRGLAAAARLQAEYKTAIGYLERVLEISKELKEYTGDADAYGTIADCYTELGNFEKAAEFYDKYITRME